MARGKSPNAARQSETMSKGLPESVQRILDEKKDQLDKAMKHYQNELNKANQSKMNYESQMKKLKVEQREFESQKKKQQEAFK